MSAARFLNPDSDCSLHEIFAGVRFRTATSDSMTMSLVDFEPGAVVERHSHPHEQIGMVISGSALFIAGDNQKVLSAGEMYMIPGGVEHKVIAEEQGCQALDIFHPIREDYR